jgi:diketogulonate reductase-like aldo/keto reductase
MINRREFVRDAAAAAGALALVGTADAAGGSAKKLPQARIGKTGLRAGLIGIGTGTVGGGKRSNQTRLGQDRFTAMVQHAYERGVTFLDCADQYGSNPYMGKAIKSIGIPRKSVVIQTKTNSRTPEGVRADIERYLNELETDYIDIVLLHCMMQADWNVALRGAMDVMAELKQKKVIRAHGVSCHHFGALETASEEKWVDVDLARYNPWGKLMDVPPGVEPSASPPRVLEVLKRMKEGGKGVIGMKVLAEGQMARGADKLERAYESIKFSLDSGAIDLMVVGFESEQQVDEIVEQTWRALDNRKRGT